MRRALMAATFLIPVLPAAAQQAATPGRYQVTPSESGFTRLDTQTGAVSHCDKRDGVWYCEPLGENEGANGWGQLGELTERVSQLGASLDALATRLDAIAARLDAIVTAAPAAPAAASPDEARRSDEAAMNFAERMMQRFFDMVREMKAESASGA